MFSSEHLDYNIVKGYYFFLSNDTITKVHSQACVSLTAHPRRRAVILLASQRSAEALDPSCDGVFWLITLCGREKTELFAI